MIEEQNKPVNYDSSSYLIKRLFLQHIKPHFGRLSLAIICMLVVAVTTAAMAYLMEPVMDSVFVNKNKDALVIVVSSLVVVAFLKGIAAFGQSYFLIYVTQRIITKMQIKLYRHLLNSDIDLITGESSGRLVSRFNNDFNILRNTINIVSIGFAKEFFTMIFLVSLMFYQSVTLALIAFLIFPIAIYPIIRLGKRMRKVSRVTQEELGNFSQRLSESFQNAAVIKAYGQEEYEVKRASLIMEGIFKLYIKAARIYSSVSPMMEALSGLAIAAVIWYGGLQVMEGVTTTGKFTSFITAALLAYKPVKTLSNLSTNIQEGLAAAKRLFIMMDSKPNIVQKENAIELNANNTNIKFDNVCFSYNDSKQALNNLNINIKSGQTIALVGSSGGGKSTIISLMMRFYDVSSGSISINDIDIKDISFKSLRENIAFVSQNIVLFDDTVKANISYGDKEASFEQITQAAKDAAAHDFIMELENGYDTVIGSNGFTLSGGQRQRISIARAMLRKSPILLLDEATSALDSVSEKKIQKALNNLTKDRTTIIVAHRLSTIENADKIFVIKKGQVVESGNHDVLLNQNGEYDKLYRGDNF